MFTPKQRSQLTDAVIQSGMDRSYFKLVETDTELRLTYLPDGFYFRVTILHLNSFADKPVIALITYHTPDFSGLTPTSYQEVNQRVPDWSGVFANEKNWLAWIKREYYEQTPHGQAELEEYQEMAEIVATTPMTPFFLIPTPKSTSINSTATMEKRYQIFISSTFADLKEERGKVQQAVMELDCIPAGMELFPAIDEDQFEFIKKVIDDCDYYLLVIGGRYGSLSDEGVSYTEMEYRYAVSKGIKVIAFLHKDPDSLPVSKSETDVAARKKLASFRDEAATGRLVRFWTEANELPGLVLSSLTRTIRTYPAVGWVRASAAQDPQIYKELSDLRKENQELKDTIANQPGLPSSSALNLAGFDEVITISGKYSTMDIFSGYDGVWSATLTWGEIFGLFAPSLTDSAKDSSIRSDFAHAVVKKTRQEVNAAYPVIDSSDYHTIKIQFKALGLIRIESGQKEALLYLTDLGEQELLAVRTVKKGVVTTTN